MRWAKPRDSAAFLIDQNRCVVATDAVAQLAGEIADLLGGAAVAAEQNEADRVSGGEELTLVGREPFARAAQDNRQRQLTGQ